MRPAPPCDDPDERRRRLIARFKEENKKPELLVRRVLHAMGYGLRLYRRDLTRARQYFWSDKLAKNRQPKAEVKAMLEASRSRARTISERDAKAGTLPQQLATVELTGAKD